MKTVGSVRRADTAKDFDYFKVNTARVLPSEDALRIPNSPPLSIEWWYFEATLGDGVSIVVVFGTKPFENPFLKLTPEVRITIRLPGASTSLEKVRKFDDPSSFEADQFNPSSRSSKCNVSIGKVNKFYGDLIEYHVEATIENVSVVMDLRRDKDVPPVRIGTGHLLFEDAAGQRHEFGWIAPVPFGTVEVGYSIDGVRRTGTGVGYHDHNWADVPPIAFAHDWYWGNARVGNFTIVASHVTAQAAYGGATQTDLVLFENAEPITYGNKGVTFSKGQPTNDLLPGAPFAGVVRYEFVDAHTKTKYTVTFRCAETIYTKSISPTAAYRRFLGPCTLEVSNDDKTSALPISELMWLGNAPSG